jgi:hypothetical protein
MIDDSMTKFPKYQRIKKERTGFLFAVQILYPISPAMINMETRVAGGSRIVLEMGKS